MSASTKISAAALSFRCSQDARRVQLPLSLALAFTFFSKRKVQTSTLGMTTSAKSDLITMAASRDRRKKKSNEKKKKKKKGGIE